MTDTIYGTFCDGEFLISDIEIDNAPATGDNPTISFTLTTPLGIEEVMEVILDGSIPVQDGTWADRLVAGPDDDECLSDLLYCVSACLDPLVASTRLSQKVIEILAQDLEMELVFNDHEPFDVWKLLIDGEEVFAGSSLHVIDAELDRIVKER